VRLARLKRHWDRLGRRDPFWAVLTDPSKHHGGWRRGEFFRSGTDEIAAVLRRAKELGLPLPHHRALDFGCGVGRVTQALADHFERCDGVDISPSMLKAARLHNRHPGRCIYHQNTAPDLRLFDAASFGFVYSTLVLQHMAPEYSEAFIRELLRVLGPQGVLVFQLPSHRASEEPSGDAAQTQTRGRLPAVGFNARLAIDASSLSLRAGEEVPLKVTVENSSSRVWAALPDHKGRYQINLANRWLHHDGELLQRDDARCPLPHDMPPGSRAQLLLGIRAPRFDGDYILELDLVQENVSWFAERGSQALRVRCRVTGGLPNAPRPSPAKTVVVRSIEPSFRERHPRVFTMLSATGCRTAYWAWRRMLDDVRRHRDRRIVSVREQVLGMIRPLVNWWKGRPFAPRMEMYCVPRSKVIAIIAKNGGRVVDTEEELMPGGFLSCRYWVVKE
jgi:ubiquinone/menaquinone biosynthesis C-methylase UbiE